MRTNQGKITSLSLHFVFCQERNNSKIHIKSNQRISFTAGTSGTQRSSKKQKQEEYGEADRSEWRRRESHVIICTRESPPTSIHPLIHGFLSAQSGLPDAGPLTDYSVYSKPAPRHLNQKDRTS